MTPAGGRGLEQVGINTTCLERATRAGAQPVDGFDPQSERFARDSALEGDGFELPVPRETGHSFELSSFNCLQGRDAVHTMSELKRLLPEPDFVALTCPLTKETEKLIDADALGRMKPSAYLVNVTRGRVVDEVALVEALAARRIAGAGIDVTAEKPLAVSPLIRQARHAVTKTM
jgi:hypothetical protein